MVWEGENVISRARSIMGATNPDNAKEGTIRRRWAQDGRYNVIHGSDSELSAKREIDFFFPEVKDIYEWDKKEYKYEPH